MRTARKSETGKLPASDSLPSRVSVQLEPTTSGETSGLSGQTSREIRLANVRAKVKALSGKKVGDAITDLIAEASLNKASLLDARRAPLELVKLLSLPTGQRRATTYRDLCELGRNLHLPSWHGSERRHVYVWYHCLHRLRVVEVEAGAALMRQGECGENAYWLLTGTMDEHRPPPPRSPPKSPLKSKISTSISFRERRASTSTGDGAAAVAAALATGRHSPVSPPPGTPQKTVVKRVKAFERLGQEALQNMPYTMTVEANSPCQLACLSRSDYLAVVALAARESFEGLRAMASLLANKSNRHPKTISDLGSLLSVTEMFRSTDPEFRNELCGLLEFLALPEGTVLFEEGDKVDFTYLILKGEVVLSRYNEGRNMSEDFAVKTTGQQFGSLSALQVGAAAVAGGGGGGVAMAAAVAGGGGAADKRRNFSARCTQLTEFAIVTKVGYTRLIRNQLQKSLNTRLALLQGMAIMSHSANQSALTRIAINCQDETFSAGSVLVDPTCPPTRLFFIVEGQAKLMWVADSQGQAPPAADRALNDTGGGAGAVVGSGAEGGGVAALMRDGRSIKRRQQSYVYELALLSRGDVVNGMVLHGRTSCFTVVAATNLKVMSLEVAGGQVALEQLFGKEQATMLRELVLLQSEVHRERAAHMVAVRQNSTALMDHRVGANAASPAVAESATFLQHYVPKTPGLDPTPTPALYGTAVLLARPSLFVPGAVQHGDVMKLVAAAGQSVLDNLPSPAGAPPAPPPSRRRGGGSVSGGVSLSGASFSSSAAASPLGRGAPPSKQVSRDLRGPRDQQSFSSPNLQLPNQPQQPQQPQQHQQQSLQAQDPQQQHQQQHFTTVVAQPVAVPRTRMRVPSPGMARELGLDVPLPLPPPLTPLQLPAQPSSYSSASSPNLLLGGALDRVSSLGQLPDPAGGKTRNGRPRAPQRTQLGLPFAGNVAMLVLENHSDLVKVVSPSPDNINCVATLRQWATASGSYCDDDGQCEEGTYGDDGSYGSMGHSVTVFSAAPTTARSVSIPPSISLSTDAVFVPQTPLQGPYSPQSADGGGGGGAAAAAVISYPPSSSPVAADHSAGVAEWSASPSSSSMAGRTDGGGGGGEDNDGSLTPFSSMPLALVAIDSDLYVSPSRSHGGGGDGEGDGGNGSSEGGDLYGTGGGGDGGGNKADTATGSGDGADSGRGTGSTTASGISASGSGGDPACRPPRLTGPGSQSSYTMPPTGGLMHIEPLTLAASQSALNVNLQQSASSLAPGGGSVASSSSSSSSQATMPSARAAAAMLSTAAIPLAAGQVHVPLSSVYRRMAPAPGACGTAGAMPTPVLAATAVVQPVVSAETSKLCSSRLATIMSTGPLAAAAAATTTSPAPPTTASLPPSTSSSYTHDYGNQVLRLSHTGSHAVHYGGVAAAANNPPSQPPQLALAAAAASPDSVVILPRMVAYESALIEATAAAAGGGGGGGGSSPSSPRGGTIRLASLGPVAASAAAAAASATKVPGTSTASTGTHATYVLPALLPAAGGAAAGAGPGGAAETAAGASAASVGPSEPSRTRPRMLRSMDTTFSYQHGTSRELLGYFSSNPCMATDSEDGGMMVFTGGIGGRPVRYGSSGPGGQRRQGGGGGGMARLGGVSLRELAGVNGAPSGRSPPARSAPSQKAQEGPELPLELDTEAPPLQNRKLSEPSLDDVDYILKRWSKKWSQERKVNPLAASYPVPYNMASEPGTPADLSRYGFTSDDLYRMAKEQADAVGVGAFKRPLTQLDLFGLPYIGGTPRLDAAPALAGAVAAGGGSSQTTTSRSHRSGG